MAVSRSQGRWAIVLAGGDGTRLQELTKGITGEPVPKQYCRLLGSRSLLEMTLDRIRPFAAPKQTMVVITQHHLPWAGEQLAPVSPAHIFIQPVNRDTGPGVLLPLLHLERTVGDATIGLFPSDHYVSDDSGFARQLDLAARFVERHPRFLLLFGVVPDRPDTELGYVLPGRKFPQRDAGAPVFRVRQFAEKPSAQQSVQLIESGALWNSFVLVFRLTTLLHLTERLLPHRFSALRPLCTGSGPEPEGFGAIPAWNFSRELLAQATSQLAVWRLPELGWTDCGTRESLIRTVSRLPALPAWFPSGSAEQTARQL